MVQQAPPEVGTVLDGYRFKGGDPSQESSWEQVEPIDVSAQYGAGARQLPNGVIERVGPRGGVQRIGSANGGQQGGATALVGADARARFMINLGPLQAAQANLERMDASGYNLDQDWGAAALEAIPFDGGFVARKVGGEDYNSYIQAAKTFEAAIMPIMSGAAVTPSEAQRLIRAAIPQPGDSPSVLAQKSLQRRQMINAVAQGIGEAAPYEVDEPAGQGAPASAAVPEPAAGGGIRPGQGVPPEIAARFGQDGRVTTEEMLAAGWAPDHENGQWLPPGSADAGGSPPPPAGPQGGVPPERARRQSAEDRSGRGEGLGRKVSAFFDGAADAVSFGFDDEISAAMNTVLPMDDRQSSIWQGKPVGQAYRENIAFQRGIDDADRQDVPVSRGAGQFAGAVVAPGAITAGRWVANAPRVGHAMTRGAAVGAGAGALYGAGATEGGGSERLQGAGAGAMTGGLIGGALPPVARAVGGMTDGVTRPIRQGIGDGLRRMTGNPVTGEDAAVRSLLRGANPDEMEARLAEGRRYGADLTLADLGGSNVQSRARVAATRQTPGREVAQDFASGRRSEVQDFAAGLGERVSPMSATPQQLDAALETYQRQASASAFGAVRGDRVTLNRDSVMALRSEEGRAAVKDAARLYASSTDEAERNIAAELNRLADVALDNPSGAEVTVGAADLMARYLNRAGGSDANRNRVFGGLGRTIRDDARTQSHGYDEALTDFASRARLGDAVETGERFLGRGHTGDFVQAAGGMDEQQRQIAQTAARAAIERASETGGSAPGLLDKLATGRGQQQRSAALLGPEGAADLQQGARVGRRMVDTGNNVNPRAGSNTFLNAQDDSAQAAGGIVGNLARGRPLQAMGGVVDMIRAAGISDEQAEMIVRLATDPSRAEDAIRILRTRFPEQEARRIVSRLTPAIAGQGGAASAPQPPRVRMVGPRP